MNGETVAHRDGTAPRPEPVTVGKTLCEPASSGQATFGSQTVFMVGDSPAMREVFDQIRRFAACDVPVMITGESGTGKERLSRETRRLC